MNGDSRHYPGGFNWRRARQAVVVAAVGTAVGILILATLWVLLWQTTAA